MADSELQNLPQAAALADTDIVWVVQDPTGTPLARWAGIALVKSSVLDGLRAATMAGASGVNNPAIKVVENGSTPKYDYTKWHPHLQYTLNDPTNSQKTAIYSEMVFTGQLRAITSITRSGAVATVTTATAHGYLTGFLVTILGAVQPEYNVGTPTPMAVTVTGATTFTFAVAGTPATPATGTISCFGDLAITITRSGAVATATTVGAIAHNFQTGMNVTIRGAVQTEYNIAGAVVTVTGATTFTFPVAGTPASPATGSIGVDQWRVASSIIAFGYGVRDDGHDSSLITSMQWGGGNAATFQRILATPPGGLPKYTPTRQAGFALEINADLDTTAALITCYDNGLNLGLAVGALAGPPWGEGLRIYPRADATNLDSRVALRVTDAPDDLNTSSNDRFRVHLDGTTLIRVAEDVINHLTIEGPGTGGVNLKLTGNGATTPSKFLRVQGGRFEILDDAYANILLQLRDSCADGETAFYIECNNSGVFTTKQVTQAPVDSMGIGFRGLRVPN